MVQTKGCAVLIVDDDVQNLSILAASLSQEGYKVRIAVDGEQALKSVFALPPDLVLMDVQMPKMDGFTACAEIKARPETADIPIIFMTSMDVTYNKTQAFELGAADYITKPYDLHEVKARVRTHLLLVSALRQLEKENESLDAIVNERTRELRRSLEEKQVLIFEIQHRVNNNFQYLVSLLHLHRDLFPEQKTEEIINDFIQHVTVLSKLHIALYDTEDYLNIDFARFLTTIKPAMFSSLEREKASLNIETSSFILDINFAIPLGHILYEIIAKCLKFNEPIGPSRRISISLFFDDDSGYLVRIGDNSSGLASHVDYRDRKAAETVLLSVFLDQLGADISSTYDAETIFEIRFKMSKARTINDVSGILLEGDPRSPDSP